VVGGRGCVRIVLLLGDARGIEGAPLGLLVVALRHVDVLVHVITH